MAIILVHLASVERDRVFFSFVLIMALDSDFNPSSSISLLLDIQSVKQVFKVILGQSLHKKTHLEYLVQSLKAPMVSEPCLTSVITIASYTGP